MFDANISASSMLNQHDHNIGIIYGQMFMGGGGHQSQALLKSLEQEEHHHGTTNSSLVHGKGASGVERSPTGESRFVCGSSGGGGGGGGGGDRKVVDFMGIGESSGASSLHEQQQQQRLEAIRQQQRLPIMNINPLFQHQHLSYGDSIESWTRP